MLLYIIINLINLDASMSLLCNVEMFKNCDNCAGRRVLINALTNFYEYCSACDARGIVFNDEKDKALDFIEQGEGDLSGVKRNYTRKKTGNK